MDIIYVYEKKLPLLSIFKKNINCVCVCLQSFTCGKPLERLFSWHPSFHRKSRVLKCVQSLPFPYFARNHSTVCVTSDKKKCVRLLYKVVCIKEVFWAHSKKMTIFFMGCGWHDIIFLSRIVYCQLKMVYIMKICKPWWRFIIMSADKMLLSKHEYFEWCFKTITITSVETVYRKRIKKKISEFFSKVLFQKCITIF